MCVAPAPSAWLLLSAVWLVRVALLLGATAWVSAAAVRRASRALAAGGESRSKSSCTSASRRSSLGDGREVDVDTFSKLLEQSDDCFLIGCGEEVEFESAATPRLLGFSMLGPIRLRNFHPDDRNVLGPELLRCSEESEDTGEPASCTLQLRMLTGADRKGPPMYMEARFSFVGNRWYASWRDVSDAKKTERSLQDWLATMSHDARTPLSSIKVSCALLTSCELCPVARELLASVNAGARVMLLIVNHVMLLKRLDAGESDIDSALALAGISALVKSVMATARIGLARQYGVAIELDQAESLPASVVMHREYVEHVLLSLLLYCVQASGNASGARKVTVRIWCESRVLGGDSSAASAQTHCLLLRVTAANAVLSPEQLAALSEPYSACNYDAQLDAGGGHGRLGLHVARRLVMALGGSLGAHSCADCGTSVTAVIPAATADAAHSCETAARCFYDGCAQDGATSFSTGWETTPARAAAPSDSASTDEDEDPGVSSYFPIRAALHERFAALKRRGLLRETMDRLLAHSPDGFTICEGGRWIYLSPGALEMLGYGSQEEALGVSALSHAHPGDVQRIATGIREVRAQIRAQRGRAVNRSVTARMRRTDGTHLWVEDNSCMTFSHSYHHLRDVTNQQQLQESLKGFLAMTMADMSMPVELVQHASQLLAQQPSVQQDEEAVFLVAAVSAASQLLSGIVSNVLSLRSLQAGECNITPAPFDVRDMVAGVLSVCKMSIANRATRMEWVDASQSLPQRLLGDRGRLSQILLNLLTNAAKFADGSDVEVSVRCEPTGADDGAQLTLVVADGGRGMSAEECTRVFDSYYRAPACMGGGTGLGLYVCKRFSEAMGGSIDVKSSPGRGARFTVTVPVQLLPNDAESSNASCDAAEEFASAAASAQREPPTAEADTPEHCAATASVPAVEAPATPKRTPSGREVRTDTAELLEGAVRVLAQPAPRAASSPPSTRRTRVLLVDDHSLNLLLCKKLLESKGAMDVVTKDDGDVALQWLIESYSPGGPPAADFVLMDMSMPRMDGPMATRQFREWECKHRPQHHLPIIALSANVFEEAITVCQDAGMDGFVPKPLRLEVLEAALAQADAARSPTAST